MSIYRLMFWTVNCFWHSGDRLERWGTGGESLAVDFGFWTDPVRNSDKLEAGYIDKKEECYLFKKKIWAESV